jgi:hypothetical protein
MSSEEIVAAMSYGRKATKLKGYHLTVGRLQRTSVGHLFTPFLRVATMTQVADATKKPFTVSEIPKHLLENVAWIVAAPGDYSENREDETRQFIVAPRDVTIEPKGTDASNAIQAPWKVYLRSPCDSEAFESILGSQFRQPGIVAAFPMDALHAGNRIAVSYSTLATRVGGPGAVKINAATRRVTIREEDVKNWK